MQQEKVKYLIDMINNMDIKDKLRLAICMSQSKWSGLIYNTKDYYERFDSMLKDIDEEYRTTLINFGKYINQEVICMNFEELKDINTYDGIWACSSILHVEKENLSGILNKIIKALKVNGIIYTSFKIGEGFEIKEGKYYNYLTKNEMIQILKNLNINVKLIDYFETLPSTKRIAKNTIWGNFIIKKFE